MHRTVVLPDIHTPNHHEPSVSAVLSFIKYYKPHRLVQLGDFCDWDSVTTYDPRRESDIVNVSGEVEASNVMFDRLDRAVPKGCEKVLIGGNHEARVTKFMAKNAMSLDFRRMGFNIRSWSGAYRLADRGWSWCDYGEFRKFGKVIYTHGWYSSGNHAQRHLRLFHENIVYGHTHEFQVATGRGLDGLPVEAASIGTLSKFNLSYLVGKPPVNWVNMFAYIDTMSCGHFTPHYVHIINGQFVEHGRVFKG